MLKAKMNGFIMTIPFRKSRRDFLKGVQAAGGASRSS